MANKPHPLQAAVRVSQSREEAAVKAMGESQQNLSSQERRLEQLVLFRGEYSNQFQTAGSRGISARTYQNYSAFLNHMDQGIVQIQQQLVRLEQEVQYRRSTWLQTRAKTKALEEVIERNRKLQMQQADRREQRENDEFSLRSLRARKDIE